MKSIITTPNKILISKSFKVAKIDRKVKQIIADMKAVLNSAENPKGVGLAAPQIGINLRIFLTKPTPESKIRVFINPKIINRSTETIKGIPPDEKGELEGCLSIPKVWGEVTRNTWVLLEYQNESDKKHQEKFTGFEAIIIQHELDHLDGILFPKKVLEQKGKLYQSVINDKGEEEFERIEL